MKQKLALIAISISLAGLPFSAAPQAEAQLSTIRPIVFPVVGHVGYSDDFLDGRSGGRAHEGNDLMGKKMLPLVAAVDGTISFVAYPQATWGYSVTIRDKDGYRYNYLHINNDTPGTDDGKGGGMFAYAPDIAQGNPVVKGQLIGWVGDSGNAESTPPHLHFEIRTPTNDPMNPYDSLQKAERISAPVMDYPALAKEILPYGSFGGGTNIAAGNMDADSDFEIVTGARSGGGPLVKVLEKDGTIKHSFYAYDESFRGGVDVAVGDIDKDGVAEIMTAPGSGGGPHIKVFKANGTLVKEFFAYGLNFYGGVNISSADVSNDGVADIITAPGKGGGPHVRVFSASGEVIKEFMAYVPNFSGGVDVAGFEKTSAHSAGIVTAPGSGGGPHIKVFDGSGAVTKEFFAYDGSFNLGVRVSSGVRNGNAYAEIAVLPATGGGPHLKIFKTDGVQTYSDLAGFEPWWRGGYDVAIGQGVWLGSGPGRRASIRQHIR